MNVSQSLKSQIMSRERTEGLGAVWVSHLLELKPLEYLDAFQIYTMDGNYFVPTSKVKGLNIQLPEINHITGPLV